MPAESRSPSDCEIPAAWCHVRYIERYHTRDIIYDSRIPLALARMRDRDCQDPVGLGHRHIAMVKQLEELKDYILTQ